MAEQMVASAFLAFAALVGNQGQALELRIPAEAELASADVEWSDKLVPFVKRDSEWLTVIGIDLDASPGEHTARINLHLADGRSRAYDETIVVEPQTFPTTRLTVEPGYVELSPENQARAAAEAREIAGIYSTLTPEMLWNEPFDVPIDGVKGGRNFGHRRVFNGQPRAPHSGADLRASRGTPVHAANRGRVVLAKNLFFSGNAVFLDHGLGVYSVYLHLSKIDVVPGQMLDKGQVLGLAGATGRVTGPHLHWGVRILDARVDPFTLLTLEEGTREVD